MKVRTLNVILVAGVLLVSETAFAYKQLVILGFHDPRNVVFWVMRDQKILENLGLKFDGEDTSLDQITAMLEAEKLEGVAVIDGGHYIDWVINLKKRGQNNPASFISGLFSRIHFGIYVEEKIREIPSKANLGVLTQDSSRVLTDLIQAKVTGAIPNTPTLGPQIRNNVYALANAKIDAAVIRPSTFLLQSALIGKTSFLRKDQIILPGFFGAIAIGNRRYLETRTDEIKKFIDALGKATDILFRSQAIAMGVLNRQLKIKSSELSKDLLGWLRRDEPKKPSLDDEYVRSAVNVASELPVPTKVGFDDLVDRQLMDRILK